MEALVPPAAGVGPACSSGSAEDVAMIRTAGPSGAPQSKGTRRSRVQSKQQLTQIKYSHAIFSSPRWWKVR